MVAITVLGSTAGAHPRDSWAVAPGGVTGLIDAAFALLTMNLRKANVTGTPGDSDASGGLDRGTGRPDPDAVAIAAVCQVDPGHESSTRVARAAPPPTDDTEEERPADGWTAGDSAETAEALYQWLSVLASAGAAAFVFGIIVAVVVAAVTGTLALISTQASQRRRASEPRGRAEPPFELRDGEESSLRGFKRLRRLGRRHGHNSASLRSDIADSRVAPRAAEHRTRVDRGCPGREPPAGCLERGLVVDHLDGPHARYLASSAHGAGTVHQYLAARRRGKRYPLCDRACR